MSEPPGPAALGAVAAPIAIRRIHAGDGPLLQTMRLAAIGDSPGSYATTLVDAAAREPTRWDRMAEAAAAGPDQSAWFAEIGDATVGMVNAYRTADDVVTMNSLWSAPGFRSIGVAEALVEAVTVWAVANGGIALRLWVVERNEHARRFYERLGFVGTGQEIPHEPDPRITECEMRKSLVDAGASTG